MDRQDEGAVTPPQDGRGRPELQDRSKLIKRSTEIWSGQLVDLTGRNNLLYFKDLRVGTLPLDEAPKPLLFAALAGRSVTLSKLFPGEEPRADAVKRARTIHNKARAHYEERGLETLYLACGMATWTGQKSASTPAAPVLLVPVQLAPRGGSQEEFEISVTGELEVNPTFLQMLKSEFDVECDPTELLDSAGIDGIIDTPEELDVVDRWLRDHCRSVPGFDVAERFVIGNFSYAKLPMVRDLEGSIEAMAANEIIAALAGDQEAQAELLKKGASAEVPSPNHIPPSDEFLVLDADSSQNYAINAVLAGRNLIIKGPPGTGKSQTITNLVSTLVARGKRVLFVAEKRAAIDAVLRRLNDVGLGDLVLDLHGGVSNRRQTAEALAKALTRNAQLAKPALTAVHKKLEQRRERLNERVDAVHEPREPWDMSFYAVECGLLGMPEQVASAIRFRGPDLERLDKEALTEVEEDLRAYVGLGGLALAGSSSPWAKATVVSAEEAETLRNRVDTARRHLDQLIGRLARAAGETGTTVVATRSAWAERVALWQESAELLTRWQPSAFELPHDELLRKGEALGEPAPSRAAALLTDGDYRASKKALREGLKPGEKRSSAELHRECGRLRDVAASWRAVTTDSTLPRPPAELQSLAEALEWLEAELTQLTERLGRAFPEACDEVGARLEELLLDHATLSKLPEIHRLRTALEAAGMSELMTALAARSRDRDAAADALEFAWLSSLLEHIQLSDPRIGAFDGEQHREVVREFQDADRTHIETTAQRVRRLCAEQAVAAQDANPQNAKLLQAEAAKKRKHLPIRQLFSAVPGVLMSLKPCWAMSPLVVSQILPSDQQYFDVVIFDEASQVRPAEAMPAILRGKQIVVAGDERQLPPTDFFSSFGAPEDGADGDDAAPLLTVGTSYESILEALAGFVDFRMLEWHYRSRDERLITFSNVQFYDRSLTTFPGVVGPDCIQHVDVPFAPGEIGSDTSSGAEVTRVVDLIIEHAEKRPDQTLGVIAMGIKHSDRIDEALRTVLRDREDLDDFFDEQRHEPFFVKNLERVQGDERDAIILSVGYGKNQDGRLLYRFGPLNQEGGERRLNVAVTRAKQRMTLVSAFGHHDMDPDRSSARGVQALRSYLEYCASRGTNLGEAASSIPELNPFEIDVRDHLTRAGIPLTPQYGSSGYRIDFAAKHPDQPGRMVLAIECDGASYHSSESARDRDRLRQEQLERLGWNFHRIWSQDWFNQKASEIERAKRAYEAALAAIKDEEGGIGSDTRRHGPADTSSSDASNSQGSSAQETLASTPTIAVPQRTGSRPIRTPRNSIDDYSQGELVKLISWIKSDTLLRTQDQLMDEAIKELGFNRRGKKILAALERAIDRV